MQTPSLTRQAREWRRIVLAHAQLPKVFTSADLIRELWRLRTQIRSGALRSDLPWERFCAGGSGFAQTLLNEFQADGVLRCLNLKGRIGSEPFRYEWTESRG